ncbi:MAG: hypothetical protein KJ852_16540 [Gammaproteobacteria bacterium]|nr:hypothetical protein [Gammaproteobacteria bacterium]MBU0786831.1 hypothetical protein [Gammaproteobacteria bacterium]MBU0813963.1 hypothetical protein [Gammaproteobacteria bacterium]MBU1788564.1 hypothetical protein [Gammaproteobacteria bacterium]
MNHPTEEEYIAHCRELRPNSIEGYIKLKLVHAANASLIVPDLLAAELGGMKWFQPKFFYGCQLSFMDGFAAADVGIELCSGSLVQVTLISGGLVASLSDSSQVFRCLISGSENLVQAADGTCSLGADGDLLLNLFHHTTNEAVDAIHASGYFRGSRWNVQGTRELTNVGYAYFTSLPKITSEQDLAKIAMASSGRIGLLRTNAESEREAIAIQVYRQSTLDRTATLPITVPSSLVASQHVYRHAPTGGAVYYEICNPDIYRVGLLPGKVAPFNDGTLDVPSADRKRFEYVVLGDADTPDGLVAPFDEEETQSLFHIEACGQRAFLDVWQSQANSDQVSWRTPDLVQFMDDKAASNVPASNRTEPGGMRGPS